MATKAKSITASDLSKLTKAAVKAATEGVPGRFIGKGTTIGFIPEQGLETSKLLDIATQISMRVAENAKAERISGLKPKPVVVIIPGKIIAGYWPADMNIKIR
jgi:hypothetical protein